MKNIISFFSFLISKVHAPFNHKELTEKQCEEIISILRPGDILLTHTRGELSNIFLDHWGHGAIYSVNGLCEAVTAGVKRTDLMFFLARKDDVIILRPKFKINVEFLELWLFQSLGKLYDYNFQNSFEKFYCFELVADSLMQASVEKIKIFKTPIGKQFLAKSFLTEDFEIVWQK